MLETIAILLIGFSFFSSLVLCLAYFFVYPFEAHSLLAKAACVVLLFGLAVLQVMHLNSLQHGNDLFASRVFSTLLLVVPPAFYFFSREVLQFQPAIRPNLLVHALPLVISPFLSNQWLIPFAFLVGAGYALWLTMQVLKLRSKHKRGKLELLAYGTFLLMAVSMLGLVLASAYIEHAVVVMTYASLIGMAFVLIVFTLLKFPDLIADTVEAARATYAASTLNAVDCDAVTQKLSDLMQVEKLYSNENLSLGMLADALGLSAHQLSELINTRFNMSFSRYVREQRVTAAKQMLIDEPNASVLSIGLSVGFNSQSNFYAAFREITGETPGQFRKQAGLAGD